MSFSSRLTLLPLAPQAPPNLDGNLMWNYAFHALKARHGSRTFVLNRLPGRADGSNFHTDPLMGLPLMGNLGAHRYPGAWTGDVPPSHLPPDFGPLQQSAALFPEVSADQLWVAFSTDLGPYADAEPATSRNNSRRYLRFLQWGVWSPIFRPHDGGNADTRIWVFPEPFATLMAQVQIVGPRIALIRSSPKILARSWHRRG
jgi:hypothetical protein